MMYTNSYKLCIHGLNMAGKLYWRVKKDGKWTWKPAEVYELWTGEEHTTCVHKLEEE